MEFLQKKLGAVGKAKEEDDGIPTDRSVDTDDDDSVNSSGFGGNAGEIRVMLESLEDDEPSPLTERLEAALEQSMAQILEGVEGAVDLMRGETESDTAATTTTAASRPSLLYSEQTKKALSLESAYGYPLSQEEAAARIPPGPGGLVWHSLLINGDPFEEDGTLKKGLNPRDFDATHKTIKPRRASLPILATDFYSSLTQVEDVNNNNNGGARYIFHGVLNGWPSLQTFEVMSIQRRRHHQELFNPMDFLTGQGQWAHMWSAEKEGKKGITPIIKEKGLIFRIKFKGPHWSSYGWSCDKPGFAFWYELHRKPKPMLTYGTEMIESVDPTPQCTFVHMVAHRYAVRNESPKDKVTYHALVLLEWDHQEYCTVIEAAYLNGLAGWRGKSNFYDDANADVTEMYKHFPPEMVCPWLTNAAEIRAMDVATKNLEEFKAFIKKYEGNDKRFVDPHVCFSHPCRLSYRSKKDMALYINNYIRRDVSYSQLKRNCQTLAADLCAFLAGKREVLPYHPVNRIEYTNRSYLFLYEPEMYDQNKKQASIQANKI